MKENNSQTRKTNRFKNRNSHTKKYSPSTHKKKTEMMTLTSEIRKIALKIKASHPSSIREPEKNFCKFVEKLEHAEITMKLRATENLIF